jgi:hypothetical protein
MVDGLRLDVRARGDGAQKTYFYKPRYYPAGIAGSFGDWIEPLPRETSFSLSAAAPDFWDRANRLQTFPQASDLWLEWTLHGPRAGAILLDSWSGELRSNTLRFSEECQRPRNRQQPTGARFTRLFTFEHQPSL